MDVYPHRLRPLARAADTCCVGPMLQILPGGLDSLTAARIASGESWTEEEDLSLGQLTGPFYDEDVDWTSDEAAVAHDTQSAITGRSLGTASQPNAGRGSPHESDQQQGEEDTFGLAVAWQPALSGMAESRHQVGTQAHPHS